MLSKRKANEPLFIQECFLTVYVFLRVQQQSVEYSVKDEIKQRFSRNDDA